MSLDLVKAHLAKYQMEDQIIILENSTATVELAAQALHTTPAQIAKTLSFMGKDTALLLVCAGDCRIDNHAFKSTFGVKAKMLKPEEVERYTNHTIGGVCPFAVPETTLIYLDESLRRFSSIYPACGSANSAISITIDQLESVVPNVSWVNVCKGKEE